VYLPKHFQVTDRAVLHGFVERFDFATLVTNHEGGLFASHLPMLLERDGGDRGLLIAHMARANRQWRDFEHGVQAVAIFQGPHTYVSPSWYEAHPSVPTWNYMVVHAYGVPKIIDDEARVRRELRRLVDWNESGFEEPWTMDLPDDYLEGMVKGIVAFEMPIDRLEGKFKLSQNRSARDREMVIERLAQSDEPAARAVAAAMETISR
jgi:transcriptional regulator